MPIDVLQLYFPVTMETFSDGILNTVVTAVESSSIHMKHTCNTSLSISDSEKSDIAYYIVIL